MEDTGWYSDDAATFGDRLAAAREEAGLTQAALARNIGVRTSLIAGWENDLKEPRANRLQMLSGLLGVSLLWLLTGEGDGPEPPGEGAALPSEVKDLLAEMRLLRVQMLAATEQFGQLEKRLRAALKDQA